MKKQLLVILVTILIFSLSACGSGNDITQVSAETTSLTTAPTSTLSEEPDKAAFSKYFSEMGMGKIPPNGNFPTDLQKDAAVFTAGDRVSLYGNIILECQPRYTIYDVAAKKVVYEGGAPMPLTGGFGGADSPLDIPAGTYEYKVYVADVLVKVFPFEVR